MMAVMIHSSVVKAIYPLLVIARLCHPTSSEVASVLEASTAATPLSRSSAATAKLVLASPGVATHATATSFWHRASLVGLLLSRKSGLTFLLVLFQQLGGLLFLQLSKGHLAEAIPLFGQSVEAYKWKTLKQNIVGDPIYASDHIKRGS